jgi:hypothetical protein
MIVMVDSIQSPETTGQPIPRAVMDATAVAGYIAGNSWPTYEPYRKARPQLALAGRIVSITLSAHHTARCLDIEQGGALDGQAPGWLRTFADRTYGPPWLYRSQSGLPALVDTMAAAGVGRDEYLIWSAHYGAGLHVCGPRTCGSSVQADGTQYMSHADYDVSIMGDHCFPPPIPTREDAMSIAVATRTDGRLEVFVEASSGEVFHAWQETTAGAWHGAQTGKRMAEWVSLGTPGRK